jgi:phosphoenolpyruvate phosphomutase
MTETTHARTEPDAGQLTEAKRPPRNMTASAALRKEIFSPSLSFLMEAHNGLSAKIVEEAGFCGLWASGLTISAQLGLRDCNEASWSQVLNQLEFMADSTCLPILVDGDTGYGNFNNVRRFVRKLGERGIAGVCIEDKLFPKANSFVGEHQPLADLDEFCGRIQAGKDSQTSDDFVLVARVEALISGLGMDEALRRAEAYHRAGADAILIHSKKSTAAEILAFAKEWGNRCPLVVVPTMYYATPTETYRQAGISTVIWANHNLRAAITAMREVSRKIHDSESLIEVEDRIASVKDVFRLVGNAELEAAERRYLPGGTAPQAIVLAASRGGLEELTRDRPKCMIDIRGRPLLHHLVATIQASNIRRITVVRGYRKEAVAADGVATIDNDRYADTGELYSLACARPLVAGETILVYGDVLFRGYFLDAVMRAEGDIVLAVDAATANRAGPRDLVATDRPFSGDYLDDAVVHLEEMSSTIAPDRITGEWIGLARLSAAGAALVRSEIERIEAEGLLDRADLPFLFTRLARSHRVTVQYFNGQWLDVDTMGDLAEARNFT